jgi:murein DD-endopeptidase MepM/ murein hydrolase activator NlpD
VTALYGLRQNKLTAAKPAAAAIAAAEPTPLSLGLTDDVDTQQVKLTIDQFYVLRTQAMSGRISRALEGGLTPSFTGDWTELADAPSLWPLEGRVASGFGQRIDPFNGEGAFHEGIDIDAPLGTQVRAAGDGDVTVAVSSNVGYGREIMLDHGHDVVTLYGHLSAIAVVVGQHVIRGQIIGYVGQSGRATGPHLHYEVRVHKVAVNPHKYLRTTYQQIAFSDPGETTPPAM